MAEFAEVMKIKKRMCDLFGLDCGECPLKAKNNGMDMPCSDLGLKHPDKAEEIILQWDKEHPVKTRLTDFLEKYPNAELRANGVPPICGKRLGYIKKENGCPSCDSNCAECWNTPLDET